MVISPRLAFRPALLALLLSLSATESSAQTPFGEETVSDTVAGVHSMDTGDMDGDGDIDVVSVAPFGNTIYWHENNGKLPLGWTQRTVGSGINGPSVVSVTDVDGDGDLDVIVGYNFGDQVNWFENDGSTPPGWTRHNIASNTDDVRSVHFADVDGDGDTDVLSVSTGDDQINWHENDGANPPNWTLHSISSSIDAPFHAEAWDIDTDGDVDVLATFTTGNEIMWFENDGGAPPSWTNHLVDSSGDKPWHVTGTDLDLDGDVDVLAPILLDDEVVWFENDGAQPPVWTRRLIGSNIEFARDAAAADMDGDGDLDVLSASDRLDQVLWHENDGSSPPNWTEHRITNTADSVQRVLAVDLDRDGDMDALSASIADNTIAWYPNQSIYLNPSGDVLSISAGGLIDLAIDFPPVAGGDLYQILISTQGTGPMPLGDLVAPLTFSKVVAQSLQGKYPSYSIGFTGTLNPNGDGFAYFLVGPGQLRSKWAGRTIHFVAVCRPFSGSWRYSSHAAPVTLNP